MNKNENKQPQARRRDPHLAGACGEKKDYVLDLPEMTAERIEAICCLAVHCKSDFTGEPLKDDDPHVVEARAKLAEIVRRSNQFIPQVKRYMCLLNQFDREVIRPEIEAKKAGTETLFDILTQIRARAAACPEAYKELAEFLRQVADRIDSAWKREKIRIESAALNPIKVANAVCNSEWRCPINEAGAECDCCVERGKNCPLERAIELYNDESGAKVGRK